MNRKRNGILACAALGCAALALALNADKAVGLLAAVAGKTRPLAFGALLALALDGPADGFQKLLFSKRTPKTRAAAVILAVGTVLVIAAGAGALLVPNLAQSMQTLIDRAPRYIAEITDRLGALCARLGVRLPENGAPLLDGGVQRYLPAVALTVVDLAGSVIHAVLAFVFSVYLLIRKEKILRLAERLRHTFTSRSFCAKLYLYTIEFARTFKRFVNGQIVEGVILGSLCFAGMLVIRLPYAALISVLIALTSVIPVIGAYIGAVPAALLLFLENPLQAAVFVVFLVALQQFEGSVIYPKVVGEAIGLDGLLVFAGVTLGAEFGGILGVIVGVPLTAVLVKAASCALEDRENRNGECEL